ncbi:tail fiber assembly protein [Escherichia coli]|nr:tail fiber assembly protein [Escherichia coli]
MRSPLQNRKKTNLMAAAQVAIYPLQDAVDLGIATDEESAMLLAWKKYRVLLMRVDTSKAPDIEWPPQP